MSDIVTRLLLNTKDFDANLGKSKRGVKDYEGGMTSFAKTAGAGIAKFAAGLGLAIGAGEAFNKTIMSSQTTGDAFVKIQDQAKASVDGFFASLAMGDFSGYLSNLQNIINKAGELSVALDNLETKTLFNNAEVNELNAKYQLELNLAKARNMSDEDRNKHLEKAKGLLSQMATLQSSLAYSNKETSYIQLQSEAAKQGLKGNVAKETWDYLLKDSNRGKVESSASLHRKTVSTYRQGITKTKEFNPHSDSFIDTPESLNLEGDLRNYMSSAVGRYGELSKIFLEMSDAGDSAISGALKMRDLASSLDVSVSQKQLEIANTEAKINGSYNKNNADTKDGNSKSVSAIGSLDELDTKLTEWRTNYNKASTEEARAAANVMIEALTSQKNTLEFQAKINVSDADLNRMMPKSAKNDFINQYNSHNPSQKQADPFRQTDAYKSAQNSMNELQNKPVFDDNDVKLNNEYEESLYGIGNVMQSLTGIAGESAAAWLGWGANVLQSIAQAIPAIMKLTTANTAKAAAEAASSAAQIPLVGWLAAGGAALSVVTAMASIPKCANGGIAYGNSLVNVGEYAGASGNPEVIAPLSKLKQYIQPKEGNTSFGGEVTFRISGTDLKGVLTNHDRKHKKYSNA